MPYGTCIAPGCASLQKAKGLCHKHYFRVYRHGRLERLSEFETKTTLGRRAKSTQQPDHILAPPCGRMYVHRVVLYHAIGHGPHRCHWCATPLSWNNGGREHELVVDHLDGNQANNDEANLVPACNTCNTTRAVRGKQAANASVAWQGKGALAVKRTLKR